jgi:hypothetical protein
MDRAITGLWTQRSPLRDADVPYLYGKFYSASRFDSLIDGINRELTARLTAARRPGNSPYNTNTFPGINSFYPYKSIRNGSEIIRVLADGKDGNIYDATAGQKSTLFAKTTGAGKARFLGLNTELFFTDGVDLEKWLYPGPWQASTNISPGTLINVGAEPGTIQMALGGISLPLVAYQSSGSAIILYVNPESVPDNFANLVGAQMTFNGTGISYLDGHTYSVATIYSSTNGCFGITLAKSIVQLTTIPGTASTGSGITGSSVPTFSTTQFGVTSDAGQQWKCYGSAVKKWGLENPLTISITETGGPSFWYPSLTVFQYFTILDLNGNMQVVITPTGSALTGTTYPLFAQQAPTPILTVDGAIQWENAGVLGNWAASTQFGGNVAGKTSIIVDSNGNLQYAGTGVAATSGSTQPTWATNFGATTTDGGITWINCGGGTIISTGSWTFGYSTHSIDGSVSTSSSTLTIQGGIIGSPFAAGFGMQTLFQLRGTIVADSQIDQIWIWRTAQGQSTLVLEDQFPADILTSGGTALFLYNANIPDTSLTGGGSLDATIPAPIASSNNPPPAGMISPVYNLGRVWAILNNTVVYSGGPDTITGNGNTAFAPLSSVPFPEQPIRLVPITIANGGLLVIGTSNCYVILGTGTASNPFYTTTYMAGVGILNYDALDVVGSTLYMVTTKLKAVSLDPSAGYVEYGFPIGDQFKNVTTGTGAQTPTGAPVGALYSPSSTYVTWAEISSGDTAVYVADGAVGWFRYSPVASPESGFLWSPRAVIVGGTSAVQAVETSPGITQLLIGPATSGPILFRDSTVNADWSAGAYAAYPSYDIKGNIVLCQSGEVAEIAHIGIKSIAVGTRPAVGLLLGEIAPSTAVPFDWLVPSSNDPPDLPASTTLYSDRYTALQNGVCPKCDNFQLAIDYGTQNVPDETLMFSVYGAKHAERRQQ